MLHTGSSSPATESVLSVVLLADPVVSDDLYHPGQEHRTSLTAQLRQVHRLLQITTLRIKLCTQQNVGVAEKHGRPFESKWRSMRRNNTSAGPVASACSDDTDLSVGAARRADLSPLGSRLEARGGPPRFLLAEGSVPCGPF